MKLLALDIDGTLITKEHVLTEGVRSALLRAQRDYDTRIILASGRPPQPSEPWPKLCR